MVNLPELYIDQNYYEIDNVMASQTPATPLLFNRDFRRTNKKKKISHYWPFVMRKHRRFPFTNASNAVNASVPWRHHAWGRFSISVMIKA